MNFINVVTVRVQKGDLNTIPLESSDLDEKVLPLHRRETPVFLEAGLRLMLNPSQCQIYPYLNEYGILVRSVAEPDPDPHQFAYD